jgi:hypothetical protein
MLVAGCTAVKTGRAIKDPRDDPGTVSRALLDPGNYPTVPAPPLGLARSITQGAIVEAQRMGGNVVLPDAVDPALTKAYGERIGVLLKPSQIATVLPAPMIDIAAAHRFVLGFTTERATEGLDLAGQPRILLNVVLRFPDPTEAAAVAAEMSACSLTAFPENRNTAIGIPGHPETVADSYLVDGGYDVNAFSAHGPYVLYQFTGSKESTAVAVGLAAKTLDLQIPLIDQFTATATDQLGTVPIDPSGLLARTVPLKDPTIDESTVYAPRGALHFEPNIGAAASWYGTAGIAAVAVNRAWVYQARDPQSAAAALNGLTALNADPAVRYQPMPGVAGLPGARCFDRGSDPGAAPVRYRCMAAADRYLIQATAAQDTDVRQLLAAQYLMLTAPR